MPNPATPESIEKAISLGMIPKKDLQDQTIYYGWNRKGHYAMWDASMNLFIDQDGLRPPHPEDDRGMDFFVPIKEEIDPNIELVKFFKNYFEFFKQIQNRS
jgi:hypothetical protein